LALATPPNKTIMDVIPTPVIIADPTTYVVRDLNPSFCRLIGGQRDTLLELDVRSLFLEDTAKAAAPYEPNESAKCLRHRSGATIPVGVSLSHICLDESPSLVFSLRKTTNNNENKPSNSLDPQTRQSACMAAIGKLIPGIAHEINNPVGFVSSNISTMKEYAQLFQKLLELYDQALSESPKKAELLDKIQAIKEEEDLEYVLEDIHNLIDESSNGMDRVKDIVIDLKNFARISTDDWQEADLNQCIETTLRIVWNELKYTCDVHKELAELPLISCNPCELNHALMALLVNSAQAITESGEIRITTEVAEEELIITIQDTGCGIDSSHTEEIFTPFFTTKDKTKHPGLGLVIAKDIIERHQGKIGVASSDDSGTTVTIVFPLT
ncbi:hypothetical protein BVY04_00670, partial [bacterium M21]